ncbi:MAG TPA: alginate export family protein, partial [Gemmatimonadaceae bacterium]|nr:alginate export family protein [Gemmatimonadaceae bacterium]
AVLWGALQFGDWGTQSHRGTAAAAEVGWQPMGMSALRPWLRAGWYQASGDDDPADGDHETFFSMVPTPRVYARMPFFTLMNVEDVFASLIVRPRAAPVTARFDARQLRLAEGRDLWYAGGGAFESTSFGYAGRPGNGLRQLATLFDLSVEWRATPRWTLTAYGAQANGGIVTKAIYPEQATGRFGYLELQYSR